MVSLPRPCITSGCPSLAHDGPRCAAHERAFQRARNADPRRAAYRDPAYRAMYRGGRCYLCGHLGADTLDHVVPLSRGGSNDPANLRPAHRACNSRKGAAGDPHAPIAFRASASYPGTSRKIFLDVANGGPREGAAGDPSVNSRQGAA